MKVAVLSGGRSSEHEISLLSGKAVAEGLRQAGHEVLPVLIDRDGQWSCDGAAVSIVPSAGLSGEGPEGSRLREVEVVFPVLHGPFGEDGVTQGALETAGLPYVGSSVLGSAVCMDKLTLKRLCADNGVSQVDFVQAPDPDRADSDGDWRQKAIAMDWPLWVKPARLGSSVGISRVERPEDLEGLKEGRVVTGGRWRQCKSFHNQRPRFRSDWHKQVPGAAMVGEWKDL